MSSPDIVFIEPPLTVGSEPAKTPGHLPNIGLCLLAAVTERQGWRAAIIDAVALRYDHDRVVAGLLRHRPRYVGLTAMTHTIGSAAFLARMIKERLPEAVVILGGVHITAATEATLRTYQNIFDVCVIGEGEQTLVELLDALENRRNLATIDGLAFEREQAVVKTGPRATIRDLDSLPFPAWHLLPPLDRYYGTTFISSGIAVSNHLITSRGCPGKCVFCDTTIHGHAIRGHSAGYVLEMIDMLHRRYGIGDIQFNDDTFVTLRKRMVEICGGLIRKGYNLTWSCDARASDVTEDGLELMKRAGCWQIAYGVETGSQRIMKFLKKRVTFEQIHNAVSWARRAGISTKGFFILGHPTETHQSIRETVDLMIALDLDVVGLTFFTAYPGSPIYPNIGRYGRFDPNWDVAQTYVVGNFVPDGFSEAELTDTRRWALRRFYLRPRYIARQLRAVRRTDDLLRLAIGGWKAVTKYVLGFAY